MSFGLGIVLFAIVLAAISGFVIWLILEAT